MVNQHDAQAAHNAELEFKIFREDIVSCPRDPALLGVVESVGGQSDSEEEEEYRDELRKGEARISWYKKLDNPMIENVAELTVVDRALMHHDIVALRSDPLGQTGFITGVELLCDCRFVKSKAFMPMLNSRTLVPVQPLKVGTYVVKGPWLGKVDECLDHVTVKFADGTVCKVANADPDTLVPYSEEDIVDDDCPYYPGVRVSGTASVLKSAKWLVGSYKPRNHEGTVVSICPGRCVVRWVAAAQGIPSTDSPPAEIVDGSKLQVLSAFANTWWQLGDYGLYSGDALTNVDEAAGKAPTQTKAPQAQSSMAGAPAVTNLQVEPAAAAHSDTHADHHKPKHHNQGTGMRLFRDNAYRRGGKGGAGGKGKGSSEDDFDRCAEVVATHTRVTVMWQDGSFSGPMPSTELIPVKHMGAHDFWPWEFVIEKADEDAQVPQPALAIAPVEQPGSTSGAQPNSTPVAPEQASAGADDDTPPADGGSAANGDAVAGNAAALLTPFLTPSQLRGFEEFSAELERSLSPQELMEVQSLLRAQPLFAPLLSSTSQADVQRRLEAMQGAAPNEARRRMEELCAVNPVLRRLVDEVMDWQRRHNIVTQAAPVEYRQRVGVVHNVDFAERVCNIEWIGYCNSDASRELLDGDAQKQEQQLVEEGAPKPLGKCEVSCYELLEHPYYTYSAGDVVMRMDPVKGRDTSWAQQNSATRLPSDGQTESRARASMDEGEESGGEGDEAGWETVSEHTEEGSDEGEGDDDGGEGGAAGGGEARGGGASRGAEPDWHDYGGKWVGELLSVQEGRLQVHWLSGAIEWVKPNEVWVVSVEDDDWDEESEWETVNGEEQEAQDATAEGLEAANALMQMDRAAMYETGMGLGQDNLGISSLSFVPEAEAQAEAMADEAPYEEAAAHKHEGMPEAQDVAMGGVGKEESAQSKAAATVGGVGNKRKLLYAVDSMSALLSSVSASVGTFFHKPAGEAHGRESSSAGHASLHSSHGEAAHVQETPGPGPHPEAAGAAGGSGGEHDNDSDDDGAAGATLRPAAEGGSHGLGDSGPSSASRGVVEEVEAFAMAEELPNHHYATKGGAAGVPPKEFSKAVRKDWKLLKGNLPEGVHVRACEGRMDLLRAVIIGPTKTPYEDALFVFDIYLQPDYPQTPPLVYFWSFGDRLNPNLYDNGKVCLSLLGTWGGDSVEVWDPAKSNILQVLISIQGLVLVPEPYYNEAGYEKQIGTMEGRHNSRQYNESTLLLTLKHMITTLNNPIPPLEDLTREHFRRRRDGILQRCRRMADGVDASETSATTVSREGAGGAATAEGAGWADRSVPEKATKGFLHSLRKIVPKLEATLPK